MTKDLASLSRRQLLHAGSATVAAGLAGAVPFTSAFAKGPILGTPAPYFYRFKLGSAEATIVSDGPLPLGDPHKNFNGLAPAEMDKQLTDNFLPLENAVLEQNVLILNTGDRMVLLGDDMLFESDNGPLILDFEVGAPVGFHFVDVGFADRHQCLHARVSCRGLHTHRSGHTWSTHASVVDHEHKNGTLLVCGPTVMCCRDPLRL